MRCIFAINLFIMINKEEILFIAVMSVFGLLYIFQLAVLGYFLKEPKRLSKKSI
jgi:hypothetical protein